MVDGFKRWTSFVAVLTAVLVPLAAHAQVGPPGGYAPPPSYHPAVPYPYGGYPPPRRVVPRSYGPRVQVGPGYYGSPAYAPPAPPPTVVYGPGVVVRPERRWGWGWGYAPFWAPGVGWDSADARRAEDLVASVGLEAQGLGRDGVAVGVTAEVEGGRLGFSASTHSLFLDSHQSQLTSDSVHFVSLHLTYVLAQSEAGRLRLDGGLDSAFAPHLSSFGPGVGLSGALGLGGPFALEAALHLTPTPFTQVDANVGLQLGLGAVALRGGVRGTYFNDRGLEDGVAHRQSFFGPYVGLAVAF